MGIGKNVQALRERLGVTFEAVASAVGTEPQTISQMEKRGAKASNYAPKLAKFFGVSLEDLLSEDFDIETALATPVAAQPSPAPVELQWLMPNEAELFSLFRACGDSEKGTILSIARSLPKALSHGGSRNNESQ